MKPVKEKFCATCKQIFPADNFKINLRNDDGYTSNCKECIPEAMRRYKYFKNCNSCGEEKAIKFFNKNKNSKDGYTSICKKCHANNVKRYHDKKRVEKKKQNRSAISKILGIFGKK